ncbi:MAG TPA: acyl-CoA dehydrogenase, partial [Alcanivorax sp.]|nr:acyl-CoA dehydrogenase [Alcanivorax sp.]
DALWADERDAAAERWRRDRPLFQVAGKPRAMRAQRAWESLGG